MGLDGESDLALSMVSDNTQRLTSAVNSLPQLMEKKRLIDMHTTIATGKLDKNLDAACHQSKTVKTSLTNANNNNNLQYRIGPSVHSFKMECLRFLSFISLIISL